MKIRLKPFTALLLTCSFTLLLTACGNSQITQSYVDPELKKLDLDGVLVVAVAKEQANRRVRAKQPDADAEAATEQPATTGRRRRGRRPLRFARSATR